MTQFEGIEAERLRDAYAHENPTPWLKWGPYLRWQLELAWSGVIPY